MLCTGKIQREMVHKSIKGMSVRAIIKKDVTLFGVLRINKQRSQLTERRKNMKTYELGQNEEMFLYLDSLRPDTVTAAHMPESTSDIQYVSMHTLAEAGTGNMTRDMADKLEYTARYHIEHMAYPLWMILGEPVTPDNLTVEQVRTLAECVKEIDANGNQVAYPIRGEDITEENYLGVAGQISMAIGADMIGNRAYTFTNSERPSSTHQPLSITDTTGSRVMFDVSDMFYYYPEPKKPNIFKRILNTLFGAYKDEIDTYNQLSEQYDRHIASANEKAEKIESFYDRVNEVKDDIFERNANKMKQYLSPEPDIELEGDSMEEQTASRTHTNIMEIEKEDQLTAHAKKPIPLRPKLQTRKQKQAERSADSAMTK